MPIEERKLWNPLTEQDETYRLFETEEEWTKATGSQRPWYEPKWDGPRWYRVWETERACGRCSHPGCTRTVRCDELATTTAREMREKAAAFLQLADEIDKMTGISTVPEPE